MNNALFWARHIEHVFLPQVYVLQEVIYTRLLPTLEGIADEADALTEKAWNELGASAGPDTDPGDLAEAARDIGIDRYMMLSDTKQGLLNLFSVALHHLTEQQQLFLLRRELLLPTEENDPHLLTGKEFVERLHGLGMDIHKYDSAATLDELRDVANAVKHAEGPGVQSLRERRPDLGMHPFLREDETLRRFEGIRSVYQPLAGEGIYVSEHDLTNYFNGVESFWKTFATDLRRAHRET